MIKISIEQRGFVYRLSALLLFIALYSHSALAMYSQTAFRLLYSVRQSSLSYRSVLSSSKVLHARWLTNFSTIDYPKLKYDDDEKSDVEIKMEAQFDKKTDAAKALPSNDNEAAFKEITAFFREAKSGKIRQYFHGHSKEDQEIEEAIYEDMSPLEQVKFNISKIFGGAADQRSGAGKLKRMRDEMVEKYAHLDPDMGPQWQACQLTGMGLYLLARDGIDSMPDDILIALFFLQINNNNEIMSKRQMIHELRYYEIYDYVENCQYDQSKYKNTNDETISEGQYKRLLAYLRSLLEKRFLQVLYEGTNKELHEYGQELSNGEWVAKNRVEAFDRVLFHLEKERLPIAFAIYPGAPSRAEVCTLRGVAMVYLFRYQEEEGRWILADDHLDLSRVKKNRELDDRGPFFVHVGLAHFAVNARDFVKDRSIELLTPALEDVDPITFMKHRFVQLNAPQEEREIDDYSSWPYPHLSLFHFSIGSRGVRETMWKFNRSILFYCQLPNAKNNNHRLEFARADFGRAESTPLMIEESVLDSCVKDPDGTPKKLRRFNKSGTFLYKIIKRHRVILRDVPDHPESSYVIVQKLNLTTDGPFFTQGLGAEAHLAREYLEDFLKGLLEYHDIKLCHVTPKTLDRIGFSKQEIQAYLEEIKYIKGKANLPIEKSKFLQLYKSRKQGAFRLDDGL